MISHEEFHKIRISWFLDHKDIVSHSEYELWDHLWEGDTFGFNEFQPQSPGHKIQPCSAFLLSFMAFRSPRTKTQAMFT